MNRRDFLLFRTEQKTRVAEVSCHRLYMRYLDTQARVHDSDGSRSVETWEGEPPAELAVQSARELFADLDRQLQTVDVVRVLDAEWLAADGFRREFEDVISAFQDRGGRVA